MNRTVAALAIAISAPALAQPAPSLDQLVAPIALYPDMLLTDILAASTYPAQIVEARRFVSDPANQGLQADALARQAAAHGWDESVQALLPFPQILRHLDTDLEWTDRLGQAFLAQPASMLDAVQRLRARAMAAGTLSSGPRDDVRNGGGAITIDPPSPQEIFVPTYDATCVYGPSTGCFGDDFVAWGDAVFLPYGATRWARLDWRRRLIRLGDGQGAITADATWHHVGRQNPPSPAAAEAFHYAPPPLLRFGAGGPGVRTTSAAAISLRGPGSPSRSQPRPAPAPRAAVSITHVTAVRR